MNKETEQKSVGIGLGRNISPIYGYMTVAILPLIFISVICYRYITDTTSARKLMYDQKSRECGKLPYIVPLKFEVFPQDWRHASAPVDSDYKAKLDAALAPHANYEFVCSRPAEF